MVKKIVVEFGEEPKKKTLELTDEQAESLYRFLDKLYGKKEDRLNPVPVIIKEREMVPYPMYPNYPWNEPIATYFTT